MRPVQKGAASGTKKALATYYLPTIYVIEAAGVNGQRRSQ